MTTANAVTGLDGRMLVGGFDLSSTKVDVDSRSEPGKAIKFSLKERCRLDSLYSTPKYDMLARFIERDHPSVTHSTMCDSGRISYTNGKKGHTPIPAIRIGGRIYYSVRRRFYVGRG